MSLEQLRALMRTYMPGRRVRLKDEAAAARRDKVPEGVAEGLILKVVPLPSTAPSNPEFPTGFAFGIEVEIEPSPGRFDSLIVATSDVDLEPLSLDALRRTLWRRTVNFPRSRGIGIAFPPGASDEGVIDDARFVADGGSRLADLVVSLRVPVDPAIHPQGVNVFYVDVDFIQCVLLIRRSSG